MEKAITRDEINEVRRLGIGLDTVAKYKGVSVLRDTIDSAVSKNIPIVCTGRFATGKSTALKAILGTIPDNPENFAVDEISSDSGIKLIRDGKAKYCTMHSTGIDSAYEMIANAYRDDAVATLLIELVLDINGNRAINSVYEIIPRDNGKSAELLNIVDVHKEKFRLVNELV